MWKLIGSPASCAAAQSGFQCLWHKAGWSAKSCGWLGKSTALWPFAALRCNSEMLAGRSQNGSAITGTNRLASALAQSIRKSL